MSICNIRVYRIKIKIERNDRDEINPRSGYKNGIHLDVYLIIDRWKLGW